MHRTILNPGSKEAAATSRKERRPGLELAMPYDEYRFAQINGAAAPTYSSVQAS